METGIGAVNVVADAVHYRAGIDLERVNSIHKTKSGRWLSIPHANAF